MKYLILVTIILVSLISCNSNKTTINNNSTDSSTSISNDTIRIANDELEYEILIFEPGFQSWLATQPPKGYYGIYHLESKNRLFVLEYNNRVIQYKTRDLYEQEINYTPTVKYGLEVNYLLYNYFIYFQKKYKQKL
mgnify:CR=1 FL=1|tara:strand:- start:13352 stop:13759 length:408 start_codon:yes stop_codon:yes gene_type:complete